MNRTLAAASAIVAVAWIVPPHSIPRRGLTVKERADLTSTSRTTFATILGGAFFLVTAYLSWQTLRATREGQITSRFNDAVAHLGEGSLPKRLGGVYALERIARDSERDHGPIMEVLAGYVRAQAVGNDTSPLERPATDVQAIITILGRRNRRHEPETPALDLSGADLRKVSFEQAHLEGTLFRNARLGEAIMREAHLAGCRFEGAHLERADLSSADLKGADFEGADLHAAKLTRAQLQDIDFINGRLDGAELSHASL